MIVMQRGIKIIPCLDVIGECDESTKKEVDETYHMHEKQHQIY